MGLTVSGSNMDPDQKPIHGTAELVLLNKLHPMGHSQYLDTSLSMWRVEASMKAPGSTGRRRLTFLWGEA